MVGERDGAERLFLLVGSCALCHPRGGRLGGAGRYGNAALVGRVRHARQDHACRFDLLVDLLQRRGRDGRADVGCLGVGVHVGQLCRDLLAGQDVVHEGPLVLVGVVPVEHVRSLRRAGQVDGLCRRSRSRDLLPCKRVEVRLDLGFLLKLCVECLDFFHLGLCLCGLAFVQQLLGVVHELLALDVVNFLRHFNSPLSFKNFSFASACARSGIKKSGSAA